MCAFVFEVGDETDAACALLLEDRLKVGHFDSVRFLGGMMGVMCRSSLQACPSPSAVASCWRQSRETSEDEL